MRGVRGVRGVRAVRPCKRVSMGARIQGRGRRVATRRAEVLLRVIFRAAPLPVAPSRWLRDGDVCVFCAARVRIVLSRPVIAGLWSVLGPIARRWT